MVTKGNFEKEVHSKVVQSLVLIAQIKSKVSELLTSKGYEQVSIHETKPKPLLSGQKNNIPFCKTDSDEIKKVKRKVPRWFKNPNQYNSTILSGFLELSEQQNQVTTQMLRNKFQIVSDFNGNYNQMKNFGEKNHGKVFDGNYNQMKNFGEKNHGKVFEEINGIVTLWEPVKEFILNLYKQYNYNQKL